MKKLILWFIIALFSTGSAFSQVMTPSTAQRTFKKVTPNLTTTGNPAKTIMVDTLYYPIMKYQTIGGFFVCNTSITSASQYYSCPQTITVNGFELYADVEGAASCVATCQLFAADANHLPTGTALATTTVTVDSLDANGYVSRANFTTPVVMTAPYCVVVTNTTATELVLLSDGDGDGLSEDLSGGYLSGTWYSVLNGFGYDIDWFLNPLVTYDVANVTFTQDKTCINDGETVTFDVTYPAIYSDPMYNYGAFVDSVEIYAFEWDFGDGSAAVNVGDASHVYTTAAAYNITLYDAFIGWFAYIVRTVTSTIDICVGIDESAETALSIYPNPADQTITVVNAEGARIEVISMLGTLVNRIEYASATQTLNMSKLSEGAYFIRITNGNSVVTRKVSVVH